VEDEYHLKVDASTWLWTVSEKEEGAPEGIKIGASLDAQEVVSFYVQNRGWLHFDGQKYWTPRVLKTPLAKKLGLSNN